MCSACAQHRKRNWRKDIRFVHRTHNDVFSVVKAYIWMMTRRKKCVLCQYKETHIILSDTLKWTFVFLIEYHARKKKKKKLERVHTDCHRIRCIKGCWGRDSIIVAVVLLARQSDECAQPLRNLNQQQNRPNHNACWLDVCARLYDVCEYPVFVSKESHCCTSGEELQHQQQFLKYH